MPLRSEFGLQLPTLKLAGERARGAAHEAAEVELPLPPVARRGVVEAVGADGIAGSGVLVPLAHRQHLERGRGKNASINET